MVAELVLTKVVWLHQLRLELARGTIGRKRNEGIEMRTREKQ